MIGIKGKHKQVIDIVDSVIGKLGLDGYVQIKEIPDIYPAGDEQVLVYELTGRVVPEKGIPIAAGCIVVNVETALNIYRALNGKAVTDTYITLAGDVPRRITVKVPVGMLIAEVMKLGGLDDLTDYAVIDGGPMMGSVIDDIGGFVTKKTKGLIVLKKDHFLINKKSVSMDQAMKINKAACEQCRMCTDICPRHLIGHGIKPHKTMRMISGFLNLDDGALGGEISQLCCGCNVCELFACPAGLYPRMTNAYLKEKILEKGAEYRPGKDVCTPHPLREYRSVPSKRLVMRLGLDRYDLPAPMRDMELSPDIVRIAAAQHVGSAAEALVLPGDRVKRGEMIGKPPEGKLGASIHASIDGKVTDVTSDYIEIRRDADD